MEERSNSAGGMGSYRSFPFDPAKYDNPEISRFIESMGLFYESYGVPRIGGRMLGFMLITSEPVSAEHIAAVLKIARSSVSTNMRTLLVTGLAEKVAIAGDRRDYYIFSQEAWSRADHARIKGMQAMRAIGDQGLKALQPSDPARQNLVEMQEWIDISLANFNTVLIHWEQRISGTGTGESEQKK